MIKCTSLRVKWVGSQTSRRQAWSCAHTGTKSTVSGRWRRTQFRNTLGPGTDLSIRGHMFRFLCFTRQHKHSDCDVCERPKTLWLSSLSKNTYSKCWPTQSVKVVRESTFIHHLLYKCHRQRINSLGKQNLGKTLVKLSISQSAVRSLKGIQTLQTPICTVLFLTYCSIRQQL